MGFQGYKLNTVSLSKLEDKQNIHSGELKTAFTLLTVFEN